MDINLGAGIAALRKTKGMTQEQLAAAVGVSPPAVSKWETGSSCPDIALLCPIARALDTNVDTLLQFEDTLPEAQMIERVNKVIEAARSQGCSGAEDMLQKLLHAYPSDVSLKYYAAMALLTLEMMQPGEPSEKKEAWGKRKKELLEQVREIASSPYRQQAVSMLASLYMQENELERAEELLKELPEHATDPALFWVQLHLKRGEAEKALEVIQKKLYVLVSQLQGCLAQMMGKELNPDAEKALAVSEVYREMQRAFGVGGDIGEGLFVDVYLRAGRREKAKESMLRFIDAACGTAQAPNPLLFSPAVTIKGEHRATTVEIRKMLLHGLQTDEAFAPLTDDEDVRAAVEKLRESIGE